MPASRVPVENYWQPSELEICNSLETLHLTARKRRALHLEVDAPGHTVNWYFKTDGDIYFGVFHRVRAPHPVPDSHPRSLADS